MALVHMLCYSGDNILALVALYTKDLDFLVCNPRVWLQSQRSQPHCFAGLEDIWIEGMKCNFYIGEELQLLVFEQLELC